MKKLMKCLREYKLASVLSIIFITLEVVLECALPFTTSKLVDQMNNSNTKLLVIYSVVLVVMAMMSLVFGALAGKFSAKAAAGFAKNIRKDMYDKISDYSFANIDKFQPSSLVTRMTTDVTNVQNAYIQIIRGAFRSPLMIVFSLVMCYFICPRLANLFVIVMVILAVVMFTIMAFAMKTFKKVFKKYDAVNESVEENIKGIRVVKSFVREDYEIDKFTHSANELKKDFTHAERIIAWSSPAMTAAVNTIMILILCLGASIIVKNSFFNPIEKVIVYNDLSIGQFQSLMTYGFQSLMALMMLQMVVFMITMSIESSRRINEVLDEIPTIVNPKDPIMEVTNGDVLFENVSFKYSEHAKKFALSKINLAIRSGQTIGILGGTGSSKTSLVNLISRLYDTTEGVVMVAGHDVKEYDLNTLRNSVAVVLQKNMLFAGTIKENLRWGNKDATDEELIHACKLACADEFIRSFPNGYDSRIEQGGSNVSGGQKQRLCIARALLKNPKILILDDSTSAVDTKTDAIIRKGLREFIPTTTKIIIAQRISSIQDADNIIVLDGGEINGVGTHEDLLKSNEIYKEIYETQNRVSEKEGM